MDSLIKLQPITWENYDEIIALEVHESQKDFVASNQKSLAQAYVYWANNDYNFLQPIVFGIYDCDVPVGFTTIAYEAGEGGFASNNGQPRYNLWRFMIDKNHQGKGYGKKAMKELIKYLSTKPRGEAPTIYVSYASDNDAARKLYESVGFVETGEIDCEDSGYSEVVARFVF